MGKYWLLVEDADTELQPLVCLAGSFPVGGAVCDRLEIASMRQVRSELVAVGLADEAEIDAHIAAVGAGELDLALAPLISAWGRRPD